MSSYPVYVGIDVACAARKRLPICVVSAGQPLTPLAIPKHLGAAIPRGIGNKEITAVAPFREAALGVASSIHRIAVEMGWHVERVAVDAPAAPPASNPRASENELKRLGLPSFRTPAAGEWDGIKQKCVEHLGSGGSTATLPHANQIWMLFGFELFSTPQGWSRDRGHRSVPVCHRPGIATGVRAQVDGEGISRSARRGRNAHRVETARPRTQTRGDGVRKSTRSSRRIHGSLGRQLAAGTASRDRRRRAAG